jgi:hypothetical protein
MALRSSTSVVLGSSSPLWAGKRWVDDAVAATGEAATGIAAAGIETIGAAATGATATGAAAKGIGEGRGMALRSSTSVVLGSSSPLWAGKRWVDDAVAATGEAATGIDATGEAATGIDATGEAATGIDATGEAATGIDATGIAEGRGMALRSSTSVVLGSSSSPWA